MKKIAVLAAALVAWWVARQLLAPVRAVRPVNGGPGYDRDLVLAFVDHAMSVEVQTAFGNGMQSGMANRRVQLSPEVAPRGMEFLYSLNRLNVATSRAQCLAVVVASPGLLHVRCTTPRQMHLANALARLCEVAQSPVPHS